MEIISLHCFLCSQSWVYLGYLWTANTDLCKSHSRRWDRSLVGGRKMTLFCLGTVPPRMEPHNELHSLTPTASWRFLLWQADVWDPHPPAPQWDFQSVRPPSGAMHTHALPLIHPYQLFLNHRRFDTGTENPHLSCFIFSSCFGESLWFRYVTKVDSLTCLDIFACSLSGCFLRYFKD